MSYGRAFFDLQLRFADRVAEVAGLPREQALLDYTNLYIRFGLGRGFDPGHPVWRDYLVGLDEASDRADWTHRFFLARPGDVQPPDVAAVRGCFSYSRAAAGFIRLHFHDAEVGGCSPLGRDRVSVRRAELGELMRHASDTGAARVIGTSWLYNLPAYRRLFPPSYVASARAAGPRFQNMPLWGQFVDRRGEVRRESAAVFLGHLTKLRRVDEIAGCFPLQPLAVEAPVSDFLIQ